MKAIHEAGMVNYRDECKHKASQSFPAKNTHDPLSLWTENENHYHAIERYHL